MENLPEEITPVFVDAVIMPNGEIICFGKTIGMFKELKDITYTAEELGEKLVNTLKSAVGR